MTHGFGWIFILYSMVPVLLFMRFPRGTRLGVAFLLVIGAHHAVAIVNTFVTTVPDADGDALRFHRNGVEIAARGDFSFEMGPALYDNFLGSAYTVFGPSQLLGSELSIIAFLLSCVLLIKFMDILNITQYRASALLVFGLLPTVLIHASITMREAWEILFFMAATYFGLRYQIDREWRYILFATLAGVALGMLHGGMAVLALFLLPVVLFWPIGHRSWIKAFLTRPRAIAAGFVLLGGLFWGMWGSGGMHLGYIPQIIQGEIFESAMQSRAHRPDSRANYEAPLDTSSAHGLLLSFGAIVLHYMLEPFPWKIGAPLDIYAASEALFRVLLVFSAWGAVRRERGVTKQMMKMLFFLYILVSIIWAVGTVNYGTALRHHLVGYWIIVLLGLPELMRRMRAFHFILFPRQTRVPV